MKTSYKFRMYPTEKQTAILEDTLETCRRLWNAALADRKNTYKETGKGRTYNQQAAILTIEKKTNPELKAVFSQVFQLRRAGRLQVLAKSWCWSIPEIHLRDVQTAGLKCLKISLSEYMCARIAGLRCAEIGMQL